MVEIAMGLGIPVNIFIPSLTLSIGTPHEFETFRYWQSCFDEWQSHPYSLEEDIFVKIANVASVRDELHRTLHKAEEWGDFGE